MRAGSSAVDQHRHERVANQAAYLVPAVARDQRPAVVLPLPDRAEDQVMVFVYWSGEELVVSIDTADAAEHSIPVRVNVNDLLDAYRAVVTP